MNATPNKHNPPWLLASVVLLAAIVAAVIFWQLNRSKPQTQQAEPVATAPAEQSRQEQAAPAPEAAEVDVAEPPAVAQTTAEVAEAVEEPDMPNNSAEVTLNASDAEVEAFLAQSGAASLNQWLTPEHKIRKLVRAINALEEGKLVSQHRPTLPPASAFTAEREGNQWRLSEANFVRYEPYISALEQAGPERLALLYRQYTPLLEQAYQELGVDKGSFEEVTRRALQQVISAPDVDDQVALSSTSVVYRYQDQDLEKLPELHKLMIRMGPENRDRVQALAQQLLQQLEQ